MVLRRRCLITLINIAALLSGSMLYNWVGSVGVNYGQAANNLPIPDKVVPLVCAISAAGEKLYKVDPKVLRAFSHIGVDFIVGVHDEDLGRMKDPTNAQTCVKDNVQPYLPGTKVSTITVGNEILTFYNIAMSDDLLHAM